MRPFDDDVVLVPVRVDRLDAVLRARDGGDLGAYDAKVEDPARTLYGPKKDWRGEDLRQLYTAIRPNMRLVLDHIAQQPPNRRVPLRELSEVVYGKGNDPNFSKISGVFNGLTGNSRKIRGNRAEYGPFPATPTEVRAVSSTEWTPPRRRSFVRSGATSANRAIRAAAAVCSIGDQGLTRGI